MKRVSKITMALLVCMTLVVPAAFAAETVKIALQVPITGKFANEGQAFVQAVQLVADQYNAKGGVLGKKVEVLTCDDEGTAMKAAICAKDLVDKGAIAVFASYTSTCAEAAQQIYAKADVLHCSVGTADSLTQHGLPLFFRISFANSAEAEFVANYLVNEKKYQRIAILGDFSTYADDLANGTEKAVKAAGGNVVYRGKIQSGSQNFTPVLTQIKSLNPDVIFFSGYYTDGGLLRAQQVQLGIKADFVGGDSNDSDDFAKLAGQYAAGSYIVNVPSPAFLPYPSAKEFVKTYEGKYHMAPASIYTLLSADGMGVFLYAMDQAKTTDTKKVAEYLHNTLKDYPGITGPISFDKNGERVGSLYRVYVVQPDGSYKIAFQPK